MAISLRVTRPTVCLLLTLVLCVSLNTGTAVASASGAASPTAADPDLIQELIAISAVVDQLNQVPAAIEQGFRGGYGSAEGLFELISPQQLRAQLQRAFDPVILQQAVAESMQEDLSNQQALTIIAFLNSDLGLFVTEQERQRTLLSARPEGKRLSQTQRPSQRQSQSQTQRVELLRELERLWRMSESNVETMIDMQIALTAAIMPALPASLQMDVAEISALYQQQEERLLAHYQEDTLRTLQYVYEPLSSAQLSGLVGFARTETGQQYAAAQHRGLRRAMLQGSLLWGDEIRQLLSPAELTEL